MGLPGVCGAALLGTVLLVSGMSVTGTLSSTLSYLGLYGSAVDGDVELFGEAAAYFWTILSACNKLACYF